MPAIVLMYAYYVLHVQQNGIIQTLEYTSLYVLIVLYNYGEQYIRLLNRGGVVYRRRGDRLLRGLLFGLMERLRDLSWSWRPPWRLR